MKLNELFDQNPPMIKVSMCRRKSDKKQSLIVSNINAENAVVQVYDVMHKIIDKYISKDVASFSVKLIDRNPVTFNIISPTANEFFEFIVSFPSGMDDVQNALITKIGSSRGV